MEHKISHENRPVISNDTGAFVSSDVLLTSKKRRGELQQEAEELRMTKANYRTEIAGFEKGTEHCENPDIFTSPFQALAESCGFKVIREDADSDSDREGKKDKYTHDNNRATTVCNSQKNAEKCPSQKTIVHQAANRNKGGQRAPVLEVNRQFHSESNFDDNGGRKLDKKQGHLFAIVRPSESPTQKGDGEKALCKPSIRVLGLPSRHKEEPLIDHLDLSQNDSTTQANQHESVTQGCKNLGLQKSSKSAFKPTSRKCDGNTESVQNHLIPGVKGKIFVDNREIPNESSGNKRCAHLNKQDINGETSKRAAGRVKEAVKALETMNQIRSRGRAMRSSYIESPPTSLVQSLEKEQHDNDSLERREILKKLARNNNVIQKMKKKSRVFGTKNKQTQPQKTFHFEGSKTNESDGYGSEAENQSRNERDKVGGVYMLKDHNARNKKSDATGECRDDKMRHVFSYSDIAEESKYLGMCPPSKSDNLQVRKSCSPPFPFNRDNKFLLKSARSANGLMQYKPNDSPKNKKAVAVEEAESKPFEFKERWRQGVEHKKMAAEISKLEVSPGATSSGSAQAVDANVNLNRETSGISDKRHQDYKCNINSNYEDDIDEMPASAFIGQYLYELWKNQCLCDVRLRIGNKSYLAHKLVLAAFSDVFCPNEPQKTPSLCFDIPNTTPEAVYQILMYLYTSEMELTDSSLECVLCAASFMGVSEIVNLITEILSRPTIDNFEHYMEIRARQGMPTNLLDFPEIVRDNLLELTDSPYFLNLCIEDLETLLQDPDIKVESEADIITSIAKWIEYNPFKRTKNAAKLLGYVNFDSMDPEVLSDIVDQMRHLFDLDAIAVLMEAFKKHALNNTCACPEDEARCQGRKPSKFAQEEEYCRSKTPSRKVSATDVEACEQSPFSKKSFYEIRDSFAAKRQQERCNRSPIRKPPNQCQDDCEPDTCIPINCLGDNCKPLPIFQDTCRNKSEPQNTDYFKRRRQTIDKNKSNLGFSKRIGKRPQYAARDTSKSPDASTYSPGQGWCSSGSSRCSSWSGNQRSYEESDRHKSAFSNNNHEASSYSNSRGSESDSERRSPCVYRIQARNSRYKDLYDSCDNAPNDGDASGNRPYIITPCYKRSQSSDRLNGRRGRQYFDSSESPRKFRRPRSASVSPASSRRFSSSDKSSGKRVTFR